MNWNKGKTGYWLCVLSCALALAGFPALALAEPAVTGWSRIELKVSSRETSMRFYGHLFGVDAWRLAPDGRAWLPLGSAWLVLSQGEAAGIDRSVFAVSDFDADRQRAYLVSRGLHPVLDEEGVLSVRDADGTVSALADRDASAGVPPPPELPAGQGDAVFAPLLLDEVHQMVSNLEVDSLFYSRLLGRTATQQAGSLWYPLGQGRLRLSQTPPGQSPGTNYFAVLVANTDMALASERVFAAGGLIETELPNGFSFWDPDGVRVVVRSTTLH